MENIDGLAALSSVGGSVHIYDNDELTNLGNRASEDLAQNNGLSGLQNIAGDLHVYNNYALNSCGGLAPVLGFPSFALIK